MRIAPFFLTETQSTSESEVSSSAAMSGKLIRVVVHSLNIPTSALDGADIIAQPQHRSNTFKP